MKLHHPAEPDQVVEAKGDHADYLQANGWLEVESKKSSKD